MSQDRKRFEWNIFFRNSKGDPARFSFYRAWFGQATGRGVSLIGSVILRDLGMAVFDANDKLVSIVKPGDFAAAAKLLGEDSYISLSCTTDDFFIWTASQSDDFWESCDSAEFAIGCFIGDAGLGFQNPQEHVYGPEYEADTFYFPKFDDEMIIPKGTVLKIPPLNECLRFLEFVLGEGEMYKRLKVKHWVDERRDNPNCPEPLRSDVISVRNICDIRDELKSKFGEWKFHWTLEQDLYVKLKGYDYSTGHRSSLHEFGVTFSFQEYGGVTLERPALFYVMPEDLEGIEFLKAKRAE